jgi:Flp pilus assembly protein TadG
VQDFFFDVRQRDLPGGCSPPYGSIAVGVADTFDRLCSYAFGGELMRRKERGTQVVEFAMVLPLVVLLSLIAAEGANMFRVYELVANGAREGARLSSLAENAWTANKWGSASATCTFNISTLTSSNTVCQGVANYAQDNRLIGGGITQCGTLTVNVNQAYQAPNDSTARYSQVSAVCAYQLQWLPRLPFYAVAGTINIKGTTAFFNFW